MSNLWRTITTEPGGPAIPTAITFDEMMALGNLAKGCDCLEIGSAYGFSAVMMARLGAKSITAVDFHQACISNEQAEDSYEIMQQNLKWYNVDPVVTVIRKASQDALPELAAQGKRYDLAFIDGDHSYENVRHDITGAIELVTSGGFIASHDYGDGGIESVTRAVDEIFPDGPDSLVGTLHIAKVRRP